MNRKLLVAVALVASLTLAACGSSGGSSDAAATPATGLAGTSWQLTSYPAAKTGAATKVPDNVTVTAAFTATEISGNGGCNQYGGTYTTDGASITIGPLRSTMMACDALVVEAAYTQALEAASSFAVSGDALTLTTKTGTSLEFAKKTA